MQSDRSSIVALPSDGGTRISYTLHYASNVLAQGQASFDITPDVFRTELGAARTFCMKAEAEMLRAA